MNTMPIDSMFRNEKNINLILFNKIDHFIEVYNNSVIELIQCFGTSFFGRIDNLASSVIKFRPKNSVPKHCIRSITYYYLWEYFTQITGNKTSDNVPRDIR